MKIELYEHQKEAVRIMRENNSYALFMDMGTGKTLPTLWHLTELYLDNKIKDALVICPKYVIGSWERDFELIEQVFDINPKEFVTVTNYAQLNSKNSIKYMKEWGAVILDESHYIKTRTSKRTKSALELAMSSKYRYILTGTPISNGQLENIFSQFAFLHPVRRYGRIQPKMWRSWTDFTERYCHLDQWYTPFAYHHVDELQDIIDKHSFRVTKEEALDLPEVLPDIIWDIPKSNVRIYDEMVKESTNLEREILAENSLTRMSKLRQISSGFIYGEYETHPLKTNKINILRDYLRDTDDPVVIFYEFSESFRQIKHLLEKENITFEYLNSTQKDDNAWRKFQSDDKIRVFVAQYQSGSAGIDLFKADTMIFYEPTLSANLLQQSRDRINRIGQKKKVRYIHMLTVGTIEKEIYRRTSNYIDFSDKLFEEYIYNYRKGQKVK